MQPTYRLLHLTYSSNILCIRTYWDNSPAELLERNEAVAILIEPAQKTKHLVSIQLHRPVEHALAVAFPRHNRMTECKIKVVLQKEARLTHASMHVHCTAVHMHVRCLAATQGHAWMLHAGMHAHTWPGMLRRALSS